MNMEIEVARLILAHAGYAIVPTVKPTRAARVRAITPALNAVGKPFSPSYDPNYRMKHKPPRYASSLPQKLGGMPFTVPSKTGIPRVWEL